MAISNPPFTTIVGGVGIAVAGTGIGAGVGTCIGRTTGASVGLTGAGVGVTGPGVGLTTGAAVVQLDTDRQAPQSIVCA
jgi:hypothetical protein